jgi:hypothetical protein
VIELKSTLRPESPCEVHKRNDDILGGIEQAHRARTQLGKDATAVVITDGYRGDFATWRLALERRVATGTLEDLPGHRECPGGTHSRFCGGALALRGHRAASHAAGGSLISWAGRSGWWTLALASPEARQPEAESG